ncbi:MAG TPA: hypothetical protein ENH82_16025 [bacterium]|nr:hypothetical protein [bacterium]
MHGLIYCAQNLINKKIYIGQTIKTLEERKTSHKQQAVSRINGYFARAIRKHSFDKFDWSILTEEDTQDKLDEAEKYWIKTLETMNPKYGYNLRSGGGVGMVFSLDIIKKLKKYKRTKEHINKFRIARMGHSVSKETREKISIGNKGKPSPMKGKIFSEEHRKKLSLSHIGIPSVMKGKHHTETSKINMSLAKIGKKASMETKQKMSLARKGIKMSKEFCEKSSINSKERWANPETREKMSIGMKKAWIKRKIGFVSPMKGKYHSEESKKKMSIALIGKIPWNKGKKTGSQSEDTIRKKRMAMKKQWADPEIKERRIKTMIGRKRTKESIEKFRKKRMGHSVSEETRKKISIGNKGKPSSMKGKIHSEESKRKMSLSHIGLPVGMTGKHHTEETKQRMRLAKIGKTLSKVG